MICSLVTPVFYTNNAEIIRGLVVDIPAWEPTPIGHLTALRSVDIRLLPGVRMYSLPLRFEGEADAVYGNRIKDEVITGVDEVITGTLDAIYIENELEIEIYRQLVGWVDVVV